MRFLFLVRGDTDAEQAMSPEERRAIVSEHIAYADMLRERVVHVLGEALTGAAATVRRDEAIELARPHPPEPRRRGGGARDRGALRVARRRQDRRWNSSSVLSGDRLRTSRLPRTSAYRPVPPTIGNLSFDGPSAFTWPYPSASIVPPCR